MRHFESKNSLGLALLAAFAYGAIACSSDTDHGPPVGAPNVPVVVVEGGGSGGDVNTGQGAANDAGNANDAPGVGGGFDGVGASGGAPFTDPSAGSANFGTPGTAGGSNLPPFGASGGPSGVGGSF